jgi:hypothetical protein
VTSVQLATISTALWVVGTGAIFILLAHWSTDDSWGFTASIVRGVRGWADRGGLAVPSSAPDVEPFRPILDPYALLRRSAGDDASPVEAMSVAQALDVELIDLGERRIQPR